MNHDRSSRTRRLSDHEFAAFLARASEIDARLADGVSLDEAREIALQAGISDAAIAAALADDLTASSAHNLTTTRWGFKSMITGVAVGAGLGMLFSLARFYVRGGNDAALFTMFGVALIPALAIALLIEGNKAHRRFQSINLALWATTTLVWASVGGPSSEFADLFFFGGWLFALDSLLGSLIIGARSLPKRLGKIGGAVRAFFSRERPEPTSSPSSDSESRVLASIWTWARSRCLTHRRHLTDVRRGLWQVRTAV